MLGFMKRREGESSIVECQALQLGELMEKTHEGGVRIDGEGKLVMRIWTNMQGGDEQSNIWRGVEEGFESFESERV